MSAGVWDIWWNSLLQNATMNTMPNGDWRIFRFCHRPGGEVPIMGFHDVIAGVSEVVDEVVQITSSVFDEK